MTSTSFDDKVVLGLILALACVLRIIGLDQPLWYDELRTLYGHVRLPWTSMMEAYEMNHHYLYSFQAKLSVLVFGESAWSLRLPAVVFGLASIAAVWVLVRDAVSVRIAHLTALLLALSYHHIWFSQNARGYTELAFWCTLGMILFLRGLSADGVRFWLWFALTLALATFTHLTGFFFFFALGVVWVGWVLCGWVGLHKTEVRLVPPALGFLLGGLLVLVLYAPVLPGVFDNAATVGATSAVDEMQEFQNPVWTVLEAVRTLASGLGGLVGLVALMVLTLIGLGAVRMWSTAPLFPVIVFAHIGLTMALLLLVGMRIWPRFFFVDIGLLMALIVLGVAMVCTLVERVLPGLSARLTFPVAAVGMVIVSAGLAAQNYRAPKQNVAGPIAFLEAKGVPAEQVYAFAHMGDLYVEDIGTGWNLLWTGQELQDVLAMDGPKWFVVGFPARTFRAFPDLRKSLQDNDLQQEFPGTLGDGYMLVYRKGDG